MTNVIIVGKPNSGKSLLFNRLTGLNQKVANFPGITVEVKRGNCEGLALADFPGIYSIHPISLDESVAVEHLRHALADAATGVVLCVLDATRLERSLVLGLQVLGTATLAGKKVVFALNMIDELAHAEKPTDAHGLAQRLGVPVVPVSARTMQGLADLRQTLQETATQTPHPSEDIANARPQDIPQLARDLARTYGAKNATVIKTQYRLDRLFLSNVWGGLAFALVMLLLFQSIFSWAAPLMDLLETFVTAVGTAAGAFAPEGAWRSFVVDGLFGGIGSFVVFVPQIFVLTVVIGLLEDSGYMARAAVICHRPLRFFGLSGRSFVPLLSGHACAIPAIMAARSIESPRRRVLTMLVVPLTVCSARLPVYALLVAALIPAHTFLGGLVGLQGLVFFLLYLFGVVLALIVSSILDRTTHRNYADVPFVVELPPYRLPHWRPLLMRAWQSSLHFLTKAGGVIFTATVVIWVLGYFPNHGENLQTSWLGGLGQWIEPVFEPIGLDWRYGVAILMSFLAREVFVGTLGTMFGIESADENVDGLASQISASGLTLASGLSLIVFYAIALQCVSTVAVLRKELGQWRTPLLVTLGYGVLAYAMALATFWLFSY